MGGNGSGGARPNAGRKPKDRLLRGIDGGAGHRPVPASSSTAVAPVERFDAPDDLTPEQLKVWETLAPHAFEARTLTKGTAERFRLLCKAVVMEAQMAAKIVEDGWTYVAVTVDGAGQERESLKQHPLCSAHRGMMQRVEAGMTAFRLAPMGKELFVREEAPVNPLSRFLKNGGA